MVTLNMSVQDIIQNSIRKSQIVINFGVPVVGTPLTGTESELGESKFVLTQDNIITNMANVLDPAAGVTYDYFTRRLNNIVKFLGDTSDMLTSFNGAQRPNMPIGIGMGSFIFSETQTAGAPTAQNIKITTVRPLAV